MSFKAAVCSPFSSSAEGAKVPDEFAFNTETITLKSKFSISSGDGKVDLVFKPSLLNTITISATNDIENHNLVDNTNGTQPLHVFGFADRSGTAKSGSKLFDNTSKYRVVGMGLRLLSQVHAANSSGYIMLYTNLAAPSEARAPPTQATAATANDNYKALVTFDNSKWDVNPAGAWTSIPTGLNLKDGISEEPTGAVIDHFQFNDSGLELSVKPVSYQAWGWRKFASDDTVGYLKDAETVLIPVGTQMTVNDFTNTAALSYEPQEFGYQDGWTQVHFAARDLPVPDTGGGETYRLFLAELVVHVEYVDNSVGVYTHGMTRKKLTGGLGAALRSARYAPLYRSIKGSNVSVSKRIRMRAGFIK